MGIGVIGWEEGISGSGICGGRVGVLSMVGGYEISLFDILKIWIGWRLVGVVAGGVYWMGVGKEVKDDGVYEVGLEWGEVWGGNYCRGEVGNCGKGVRWVVVFLGGRVGIVVFGWIDSVGGWFER